MDSNSILSLVFIALLIITFILIKYLKKINEREKEQKKSHTQQPTYSNQSKITSTNAEKQADEYIGAGKTMVRYFDLCREVIASDESLHFADLEILCLLHYVSEFTANCKKRISSIDFENYMKEINNYTIFKLNSIKGPRPPFCISGVDWVIQRTGFYNSIIKNRSIRGDWLSSNLPEDAHPLFLCSVALGDILINPDCGTDYEYAPVVIRDFFKAKETEVKLMQLCDLIREYSFLILNYAT